MSKGIEILCDGCNKELNIVNGVFSGSPKTMIIYLAPCKCTFDKDRHGEILGELAEHFKGIQQAIKKITDEEGERDE